MAPFDPTKLPSGLYKLISNSFAQVRDIWTIQARFKQDSKGQAILQALEPRIILWTALDSIQATRPRV